MHKPLEPLPARILKLWKENWSGSQIAHSVGLTRCAVLGHIHRMRHAGVDLARGPVIKRKPHMAPLTPAVTPEPEVNIPPTGRFTLMQLDHTTCRWPFGNPPNLTFCGQTTETFPYCSEHRLLAWRVPEKPQPKPAVQSRTPRVFEQWID